jgi:hypothetical protein
MAKTKIEKKFRKKYGPIVLWWDDVTEIFESVRAPAKNLEISTNEYKFSTLETAKEHFGETPQYVFKLTASTPYVNLDGDKMGTSLYIGEGAASAGLFLELDELLSKRQRKPRWMYSSWLILPALLLGPLQYATNGLTLRACLVGLQLVCLAWYLRAAFVGMRRGIVVHAQRRSESKAFFSRNKDQLALMIISALVGGLVAIGGTKVKEMYFSTPPLAPESSK